MKYRLILLDEKFSDEFREGLPQKFYRCNRIHDFEFAVNFDMLLHFAYNFSQRVFVKGDGRFFFKNLCIPDMVTLFLLTYLI